MNSENINIAIAILGAIGSLFMIFLGLKVRTIESASTDKTKELIKEESKETDEKLDKIDSRLRVTEQIVILTSDKVGTIFDQMSSISEGTIKQIDKLEGSTKQGLKDLKVDLEKVDERHRENIKDLYKLKKDKV